MTKLLFTAMAAAMLFCAPLSAHAEDWGDLDIAKLACRAVLESREMDFLLGVWLEGYISATNGSTVMSVIQMTKHLEHINTYCSQNPTKTVMEAVKAMPK